MLSLSGRLLAYSRMSWLRGHVVSRAAELYERIAEQMIHPHVLAALGCQVVWRADLRFRRANRCDCRSASAAAGFSSVRRWASRSTSPSRRLPFAEAGTQQLAAEHRVAVGHGDARGGDDGHRPWSASTSSSPRQSADASNAPV